MKNELCHAPCLWYQIMSLPIFHWCKHVHIRSPPFVIVVAKYKSHEIHITKQDWALTLNQLLGTKVCVFKIEELWTMYRCLNFGPVIPICFQYRVTIGSFNACRLYSTMSYLNQYCHVFTFTFVIEIQWDKITRPSGRVVSVRHTVKEVL